MGGERARRRDRCRETVAGAMEDGQDRVPLGVRDLPGTSFHRAPEQAVLLGQRVDATVAPLLEEAGGALSSRRRWLTRR